MNKLYTLIALTVMLLHCFLQTQGQSIYSFKSIGTDNGLSDNYVEHVIEDSRGFIWIATHSGLNRYDGTSFKLYTFPPQEKKITKLNHNFITYLHEDAHKSIWIGTFGGLYRKIPLVDSFVHYEFKQSQNTSLSNNSVECIISDKNKQVWIATQNGLNRYEPSTDSFKQYFVSKKSDTNIFFSLAITSDNCLWVGSYGNGLFYFNNKTDRLEACSRFKAKYIRCLFTDTSGNLWIGTTDASLWRKPAKSADFEQISLRNIDGKQYNTEITSIVDDLHNGLWLGTSDRGVLIYNKATKTTEEYNESLNRPFSLTSNSVDNVSRDSKGVIWVSTHGGGANYYSPHFAALQFQKSKDEHWLQGNIVSCFLEDSNGRIWVGTDGAGFCQFDTKRKQFITYNERKGLASNAVLDIQEINKNTLAIASWNGGLSLFSIATGQFKNFAYNANFANAKGNNIRSLIYDSSKNYIYCATFNTGVRIFDLKTKQFLPQNTVKNSKSHDYSLKIAKQNNSIWGFSAGGAFRINSTSVSYFYKENDCTAINNGSISDLLIDSKQRVWILTQSGLNKYNKFTDKFTQYNFQVDNLKSIVEDGHGNLWLSSGRGIFRFDTVQQKLENISLHWSVPIIQGNFRSAYRTKAGYLYFGGIDGFVCFHEDSLHAKAIKPRIFITRLLIHNIEQTPNAPESALKSDIIHCKSIVLQPTQSFITLEFASLNYVDNSKNRYQYRLQGFDKQWNNAGTEHKAVYTNLPPGSYRFTVRCSDSEGLFSGSECSLDITVLPPWWATMWFKILLCSCSIVFILCLIYIREQSIRTRNKRLEQQVQKRTNELASANQLLSEQKEELFAQYTQVEEQQSVIKIKNDELTETIQTKDKIISVLAHDLRNPLTTLVGFSELLQHSVESDNKEKLRTYSTHITTSSQSILNQINSLLEWAGSRTKDIRYTPENTNLDTIIKDAITLLHETTIKKRITIRYFCETRVAAWCDSRMISTVIRNILTNSIKYSHKGGTITVTLFESMSHICFSISDSGIGIDNVEKLEKGEQSESRLGTDMEKGFGMGMIICKDFISKNYGILEINSQPNEGACFTVKLPIGHTIYDNLNITSTFLESSQAFDEETIDDREVLLVIEDNDDLASYFKNTFSSHYQVIIASDGAEGLSKALELIPDMIFCDIHLPRMNGREVCHSIKSNPATSHVPVFFITSESQPEQQIQGLLLGADDYIVKPFNIEVLKMKVLSLKRNRDNLRKHLRREMFSEPKSPPTNSNEERFLRSATQIIEQHLSSDELSVEFLAQQMALSRAQIFRKFKSIVGQSPNDFIKIFRLRKAAEMLRTGNYRISEVAYATGFADPRYFSTCFAKEFGVTPSRFIENNGNSVAEE